MDKDVYDYIRRVQAKPFDLDFDVQVEAAEELYGMQLKLSFSRKEISKELKFVTELYGEKIYRRVEQVLFEQMRKYQIYF